MNTLLIPDYVDYSVDWMLHHGVAPEPTPEPTPEPSASSVVNGDACYSNGCCDKTNGAKPSDMAWYDWSYEAFVHPVPNCYLWNYKRLRNQGIGRACNPPAAYAYYEDADFHPNTMCCACFNSAGAVFPSYANVNDNWHP